MAPRITIILTCEIHELQIDTLRFIRILTCQNNILINCEEGVKATTTTRRRLYCSILISRLDKLEKLDIN